MPSYPLRALVLRKTKLGETDIILTLLASDGRQVRAVAKGARKTLSRLGARLEPFTVADLLLHSGRTLEIVTDARAVDVHEPIREDFDRTAAAYVVVDLADKLSVEGQAEERLYSLCLVALQVLGECPVDALDAVVAGFLVKAVAIHGLRPELAHCASCAGALYDGARFSAAAGGSLCPECGEADPGAPALSADARDLLEFLIGTRLAEIPGAGAAPDVVSRVLALLRGFITFHLAGRPKALEFFMGRG